jgi:hypothetical protein
MSLPGDTGSDPIRRTTRRLMNLVAIGAVRVAVARSTGRLRLCLQLADNSAWLRTQEPWTGGMVTATPDQARLVIEPTRVSAEYYSRQEAKYRRAVGRFRESVPQPDPSA